MRRTLSSPVHTFVPGTVTPIRRGHLGWAVHTLTDVAQRPASGSGDPELEGARRLAYWVRRRMKDVGIKSVRSLAAEMGMPGSNAARYFKEGGSGRVPLVWLGELTRALKVDPVWFTVLPPVPSDDPVAPYALDEDDPILVAIAAARLARSDQAGEGVADPPVASRPPTRPRKRAARVGS